MEDVQKKIEEYSFKSFSVSSNENVGEISEYELQDIDSVGIVDSEAHEKVIRLERDFANKSKFLISPIVREHRGINNQEDVEKEDKIQNEVEKRLLAIEADAFQKGFDEGLSKGREEVFNQVRVETEEKLSALSDMVSELLVTKVDIIKKEKDEIFKMVRTLTKWIILRELKDDGTYIYRLLDKLISEVQTKSNILLQVNEKHFENMPDVLEHVQKNVGKLENVRVETDYDIEGPGLILDTENGIVNGTLIEQFKNLEKLFLSVGLEEGELLPTGELFPKEEIQSEELEAEAETESEETVEAKSEVETEAESDVEVKFDSEVEAESEVIDEVDETPKNSDEEDDDGSEG